ncbi:MAG: hypothetical protein AB8G22_02540 [Saprospiraceae bacterium]
MKITYCIFIILSISFQNLIAQGSKTEKLGTFLPVREFEIEWEGTDPYAPKCLWGPYLPKRCSNEWPNHIKRLIWQLRVRSVYDYSIHAFILSSFMASKNENGDLIGEFKVGKSLKGEIFRHKTFLYNITKGFIADNKNNLEDTRKIYTRVLLVTPGRKLPSLKKTDAIKLHKIEGKPINDLVLLLFPFYQKEILGWEEILEEMTKSNSEVLNVIESQYMPSSNWDW